MNSSAPLSRISSLKTLIDLCDDARKGSKEGAVVLSDALEEHGCDTSLLRLLSEDVFQKAAERLHPWLLSLHHEEVNGHAQRRKLPDVVGEVLWEVAKGRSVDDLLKLAKEASEGSREAGEALAELLDKTGSSLGERLRGEDFQEQARVLHARTVHAFRQLKGER